MEPTSELECIEGLLIPVSGGFDNAHNQMNCLRAQIFFKNFCEFAVSKGHMLDFKVGRAAMS